MTTILNAPQDDTTHAAPRSTARRHFLQVASSSAGALALELSFPAGTFAATTPAQGVEVTAWVVVYPNDDIVIRVARSEMGQGSSTGLPMLVAEELECDWNRVKMEFAGVNEHIRRNRVWVSMGTGGSRSIRDSNEFLRKAGATSRTMLVTAASEQWKVPVEECVATNSVITHTPTGRKLRYGQVATAASKLTPPRDVKLKDPKDWKLIGKPVKRFDMPDKVLGKPIYGIDVQLPGMLYASLVQCPVFGGKLKSVDKTPAMNMRGVKQVVELPDAVAVVADNWWRANNAVKALKVEWDVGENGRASSASIKSFLAAGFDTPMVVARKDGDVNAAFASAAKVVEAEYYVPYLNHATLEPQNATAWLKGDRLEVWAPTQNGEATIAVAAETAGLPLANVEVYKTQLGGGFGRRGAFQDWARYAVLVAKAVPGTPVKTLWTREEDMQHGAYRPASIARFKAGIDAQGKMTAWSSRFVATSIVATVSPAQIKDGLDPQFGAAFADSPYDIPNLLAESRIRTAHVPVGFWRSVFHSQNPYAREAFFDEVAKAGGRDPVEFRRELLVKSPDKAAAKYLGVLDAVAKAVSWGSVAPAGVFRGIAVCDAYGSYAAAAVELSVDANKVIDIKRVIVAADPGYAVNRDAALAQMEGNMIFGLTLVMYGENTVKDGRIEQSNFHDYQMARMRETPKFEGILMPSGGFWGGMGEPPLAPFIPAMANAVAAATGQPVRTLPLKNQGFKLSTAV